MLRDAPATWVRYGNNGCVCDGLVMIGDRALDLCRCGTGKHFHRNLLVAEPYCSVSDIPSSYSDLLDEIVGRWRGKCHHEQLVDARPHVRKLKATVGLYAGVVWTNGAQVRFLR